MENSKAAPLLAARASLPKFRADAVAFCDRVASLGGEVGALVRSGRSPTLAPLAVFIDRLIGIAKRAKVLPSTPSRRSNRQTDSPPAFYSFVITALRVARQVIKTSQLPDDQITAALSKLQYQDRDALIEIVVQARGRIGNYRETPHGLVEWDVTDPDV